MQTGANHSAGAVPKCAEGLEGRICRTWAQPTCQPATNGNGFDNSDRKMCSCSSSECVAQTTLSSSSTTDRSDRSANQCSFAENAATDRCSASDALQYVSRPSADCSSKFSNTGQVLPIGPLCLRLQSSELMVEQIVDGFNTGLTNDGSRLPHQFCSNGELCSSHQERLLSPFSSADLGYLAQVPSKQGCALTMMPGHQCGHKAHSANSNDSKCLGNREKEGRRPSADLGKEEEDLVLCGSKSSVLAGYAVAIADVKSSGCTHTSQNLHGHFP